MHPLVCGGAGQGIRFTSRADNISGYVVLQGASTPLPKLQVTDSSEAVIKELGGDKRSGSFQLKAVLRRPPGEAATQDEERDSVCVMSPPFVVRHIQDLGMRGCRASVTCRCSLLCIMFRVKGRVGGGGGELLRHGAAHC